MLGDADAGVAVTLPSGLWLDGAHRRELRLRPLDMDGDAAFLLDLDDDAPPASRATALLARCLLPSPAGEGTALARALTVGDREALLLHLRRLTLGDAVTSVVACPHCGESVELTTAVSALLLPPYRDPQPSYPRRWVHAGAAYDLVLRLPTGADVEAAGALARAMPDDAGPAAALLLRRCTVAAARDDEPVAADELPAAVRAEAAAALAALDPQAELVLNATCPACARPVAALLDAGGFLLGELETRARTLHHEVHALALHYHWSERDILQLGARRRRRYLELLASP
jgi:hypothetical protein